MAEKWWGIFLLQIFLKLKKKHKHQCFQTRYIVRSMEGLMVVTLLIFITYNKNFRVPTLYGARDTSISSSRGSKSGNFECWVWHGVAWSRTPYGEGALPDTSSTAAPWGTRVDNPPDRRVGEVACRARRFQVTDSTRRRYLSTKFVRNLFRVSLHIHLPVQENQGVLYARRRNEVQGLETNVAICDARNNTEENHGTHNQNDSKWGSCDRTTAVWPMQIWCRGNVYTCYEKIHRIMAV